MVDDELVLEVIELELVVETVVVVVVVVVVAMPTHRYFHASLVTLSSTETSGSNIIRSARTL